MVHGRTPAKVQSPGICRRLLNFLMSRLIDKGVKQITLGAEIPIETPSRKLRNSSKSKSHGEIVVEFRHIEATKKKNGNGVTVNNAIKEEPSHPEVARNPPYPNKTVSRFRGNHKGRPTPTATPVPDTPVWNGETDVEVIHRPEKPAGRETSIDKMAEEFINSRLDVMHKRAS